jgi:TonB family protein
MKMAAGRRIVRVDLRLLIWLLAGALLSFSGMARAQETDGQNAEPERIVYRAGTNGVGIPQCIYCPQPEYSEQARDAQFSGSVIVDVIVTADGRATNPVVLKDPGLGLAKKAVDQLRSWKMKPAPGPDGKPVDCRVQLEVDFHLSGLPHHVSTPTAEEYPIPISVAQEAKLGIGYRGVVLGQNVYVSGTKIVDQAVAHAICNVSDANSKPQLTEDFFRQPGSTACSVYADKDGRVARIVVEARMSILRAIDMLTKEYGPPKPGLYPITEGATTNGTLWSWTVRDEHLASVDSPKISVEPKVRTNQKKDEYDSYVEIVYWH